MEQEISTSESRERKCVTCKAVKPATPEFFYKDKNRLWGLMYRCKDCDKLRKDKRTSKERIAKETPEQKLKRQARLRRYNKSERGRTFSIIKQYEAFDRKRGLATDITFSDLLHFRTLSCAYCGYPATGVDRLDNKQGHTKINSVPCCKECNVARMDNFSPEEMIIIGAAIKHVKDLRNT